MKAGVMARKPETAAQTAAERSELRELAFLALPKGRAFADGELQKIIRLLILAHHKTEKRAVVFRAYHALSAEETGRRVGITPAQVVELLDSLDARERLAGVRERNNQELARLGAGHAAAACGQTCGRDVPGRRR